jgi:hypothetical protein
MNLYKKISCFFFASLFSCSLAYSKTDFHLEDQPSALFAAQNISCQGTLQIKENGFVYLDIDNAFITSIAPLLDHPGRLALRPTSTKSVGAHISVFHELENVIPNELGMTFSFSVRDIRSFVLKTKEGLKKLWVIAVDAPELEMLRLSYGYSEKLKGFDFHITLGNQMPSAPEGWEESGAFSPLNTLEEPTEGISLKGDFTAVERPDLLEIAQRVNQVGQLCLKNNGYVYLNVDNAFIHQVTPLLPVEGSFSPLPTSLKSTGAHITTLLEDEMIGQGIWDFKEAGEWIEFQVKEVRYIERKSAKGKTRLWLLAVDAPGLERLRTHYGLKSKVKGHDFHITLGTETVVEEANPSPSIEDDLEDAA